MGIFLPLNYDFWKRSSADLNSNTEAVLESLLHVNTSCFSNRQDLREDKAGMFLNQNHSKTVAVMQ